MLGTTWLAKLRGVLAACGLLAVAACGGAGSDDGFTRSRVTTAPPRRRR